MSGPTSDQIIVGVDGSATSDAAIRWAAREAAMRNVTMTLVHVVTPGLPVLGMGYAFAPLPMNYGALQKEEGQRVIESARHVAQASIAPDGRVQIKTAVHFANPIPTLIDVTKDSQMIVVGCRGQGAWRRGLFGSVSTALLHHAHCPVAIIQDPADPPSPSHGPVVLGVDGSAASELATAIAFDKSSWRGVDLVAIHAWLDADVPGIPRAAWPDFQAAAEETLAERLAGWSDRYPDVTVQRRVVFNQPARHLLEAAEAAQLVVVGSHGRGGFAGMLLGSVGSAVAHGVHAPVIVARHS